MSDDVVHNRIAVLRADRRVSRRELAEALGVPVITEAQFADLLEGGLAAVGL